jgi:hypothetical protein
MKMPRIPKGRIGDAVIIVLSVILILLALILSVSYQQAGPTPERADDVASFVSDFGKNLQQVSLLAPDAATQIETKYGPFVSEDLLVSWEKDPMHAPGRLTSSPWPDSIKVSSVQNVGIGTYVVKGAIIERVNAGTTTQKVGETPVTLGVSRIGADWKIVEYAVATSS